ncbi:hypothetical protein ILUMI_09090 [Ignelater luminosus]|uniref:LITAF domain-containing protein n=1 Tax=Ignelater luminosus TaxID=2038154 RepID=A0A8K0GA04_IGNLU|nr:hypothetical protein ILUMI_09090 [Ignelater luminosus]
MSRLYRLFHIRNGLEMDRRDPYRGSSNIFHTRSSIYSAQPTSRAVALHSHFGPIPILTVCPSCKCRVVTRAEKESSTKTHLIAAVLCVSCFCCLPYCLEYCKSTNHYCPNCNAFLGTYQN